MKRKLAIATIMAASVSIFAAQAQFKTSEYGDGESKTGSPGSSLFNVNSFSSVGGADLSTLSSDLDADCSATTIPDSVSFMDTNADGTLTCQEVVDTLEATEGVSYTDASPQQATFIIDHLDTCSTVDAACLTAAANAANNFLSSTTSGTTPAILSSLGDNIDNGSSVLVTSYPDLAVFDTDHDGEISDTEVVNLLEADPNVNSSSINKPSGDEGRYARAYLNEIASLAAGETYADAISRGNNWAVEAPTLTAPASLALDGTDSTIQTAAFTVVDGKGATAPGNVTYAVTTTKGNKTYSGKNGNVQNSPFIVNSAGRLVLNTASSGVANIEDLDSGTYTVSITATDNNTDSYGRTATISNQTVRVSNENGCITNTQVSDSDFNASGSIDGAAVSITGSFDDDDLLFIQGSAVTASTVGANSIKRYQNLGVSGVSRADYDPTTGIMRFYGSTTEANWISLFKRVGYIFDGGSNASSTRKLAFTLSNRVPYLHEDGTYHFYEYFRDRRVNFRNARTRAANKTLFGMTGYLATPTSAAEQAILKDKVQGVGWIGACDLLSNTTVMSNCGVSAGDKTSGQTHGEGYWYWVTGPEKMTYFGRDNESASTTADRWQEPTGNNANGSGKHTNVYENWNGTPGVGEPNNCCGSSEHYLHVWGHAKWNDFAHWNRYIDGYLVEWGGQSGDSSVDIAQTVNYSIPNGDANFCSYAE